MGACEPGQARDRAAISGNFHVPGFSLKAVFLRRSVPIFPNIPFFRLSRRRSWPPSFFPIFLLSPIFSRVPLSLFFPFPPLYRFPLNRSFFSKNFAEFAKKSDKIAPRRLFYRVFRLK